MPRGAPRLEIGFVRRAHGVRGELAVVTHDPESTVLAEARAIWLRGVEHAVAQARPTAQGWLVRLAGVDDRDVAEGLRGAAVEIDRALVPVAEGEVVLDDLVGCAVRLRDGTPWGTVVAIDVGPMQDRLVIHDGERERLLPLVDAFIADVDLTAGVVTVTPPEGLPDAPITGRR